MISKKYKVHEAAKDFEIGGKPFTSKDIVGIVEALGGEAKKYSSVLEPVELDYLFDVVTSRHQLANFMEFFAEAMNREVAKPAPAEKPAETAEKPAAAEPAPAEKAQPAASAETKAAQPPRPAAAPTPPKSEKVYKERVLQPQVEKTVRTVDTRGGFIDSDKYNERYEQNSVQNTSRRNNFDQKKQKINQKSRQQNRAQYSSKRETEAEKMKRLQLEMARKQQLKVIVPDEISVSELASRLKKSVTEVVKKLFNLGMMLSASDILDYDTAALIALEFGAKVEREVSLTIEERIIDTSEDEDTNLVERSPVIVVMGHVDHGKTSILDAFRKTSVVEGEAGGITQHIGAYTVKHADRRLTFLDTPGHEAFTSMRARGAKSTDIAIIVIAADDGIMPQTIEAINHAKAAEVSLIIAINKMDKPSANPDKIKQQLTEHNIVPEEWGGDTPCVPVSAMTGAGLDDLLETVILVADMLELKANPNRAARGTVIESRLDKGRGPIATLLVQNGTLNTGDIIVAGDTVGRVRTMVDDKGRKCDQAGPSMPVEITGLDEVPTAGEGFDVVSDERLGRELVDRRRHEEKESKFNETKRVTLDNLFATIQEGELKELPLIVKGDVNGSVEAVCQSLMKIKNEEVRIKIIHSGVGAVNETDVMLAQTSGAIIVGFNVRPDPMAAASADRAGVDIRMYRIIYDCINEITDAMKGMLDPKFREIMLGHVEVREVYRITGTGIVAGSYVRDGKITRNANIRIVRDGIIIAEDKMSSLRRFKEDVREVASGYECGISLDKYSDIKEGDIFEAFVIEEYRD